MVTIHPLCGICFKSKKFCFTMEVISKQGLQKPFVTVCSTYLTILKTESGLFDKFVYQTDSQTFF